MKTCFSKWVLTVGAGLVPARIRVMHGGRAQGPRLQNFSIRLEAAPVRPARTSPLPKRFLFPFALEAIHV